MIKPHFTHLQSTMKMISVHYTTLYEVSAASRSLGVYLFTKQMHTPCMVRLQQRLQTYYYTR
jgi:hypothetical protein